MNILPPQLSIIIPYHNEGKQFILETIDSIETTIDVRYEIIVVDDCSDEPLKIDGIKIIRHKENLGVGQAFDTGVRKSRSKNLFLMGSDIRFIKNQWASKMVEDIKKHPDSLICTSVVPLQADFPEITFETAKKYSKIDLYRGASIVFFMGDDEKMHYILEAQWMPREFLPLRSSDYVAPTESYEVACVLGAAYGVTKKWYKYLDGFWGHKKWGTLEPYISLKSWLFGGSCLIAPHIETAHIFKSEGTHKTGLEFLIYNKIMVAWLLFPYPDKDRLINWLQDQDFVIKGKELIEDNIHAIQKKRYEYRNKMKTNIPAIVEKFNLKF